MRGECGENAGRLRGECAHCEECRNRENRSWGVEKGEVDVGGKSTGLRAAPEAAAAVFLAARLININDCY